MRKSILGPGQRIGTNMLKAAGGRKGGVKGGLLSGKARGTEVAKKARAARKAQIRLAQP